MAEELMGARPRFLTVLCALSMTNAVYGMLTGLASALSPVDVDDAFLEDLFSRLESLPVVIEDIRPEIETYYMNLMLNMGNLGAANFLFYGINLVGVMLMFRLNKIGFVLYVLAQLGIAFSPALFGGFSRFGQISLGVALFWNAIWVVMYATQLKRFYK